MRHIRYYSSFVFLARLLAYWLLFFAVFRLWFVGWFYKRWPAGDFWSVPKIFIQALPLDLSMASYLMAVPVLIWFVFLPAGDTWRRRASAWIAGFNFLLIAVLVMVFGANVFIYQDWHTLINNRAIEYMRSPNALFDSMSGPFMVGSVLAYISLFWLSWKVYKVLLGNTAYAPDNSRWQALLLPVQIGLLFLALRGGLGVMPINESAVYVSRHLFNNHAATNTGWHFLHSVIEARSETNHFQFLPTEDAAETTLQLMQQAGAGDAVALLDSSARTPNVVFIIMESMTAQVIESLGGEKGVCPQIEQLVRDGVLFRHCYGSGYRTDQGLISVLAGYPAQPDQSVVLLEDKAVKLPSLPRVFKSHGYRNLFMYGGELTFANIGVWLGNQRFDKIMSENDFPAADKTQRWGVDDARLLQRLVDEVNALDQPFFATALTLSLHPPYDVPFESAWNGPSEPQKFLHCAAFTDDAVGKFFENARRQPWYANTLFVLVADHGASQPGRIAMDNPGSRHLPLILFGEPIRKEWRGRKFDTFGNHHDIPATVLYALNMEERSQFRWSRNLAITSPNNLSFAYYTNENGVGWATPAGAGFYEFEAGAWQFFNGQPEALQLKQARAYLQHLYDDFLGL